MTAHDGGNGLDAKEYARVRATVCTSEWTGGDLAAWFAMCALYVITHVPIAAIRAHTDADAVLVAVMYPLYLLVVAYMSKDLFAKYATRDNRFCTRVHFWMYLPFWVHSALVVVRDAYFNVILFFFITTLFNRNKYSLSNKESLKNFVKGKDYIISFAGANRGEDIKLVEGNVLNTYKPIKVIINVKL
jgi:hypothetical protein